MPKTFTSLQQFLSLLGTVLLLNVFAQAQSPSCREVLFDKSAAQIIESRPWFDQISFEQTEIQLLTRRVVKIEDMRTYLEKSNKRPSGISGAYLVTFENGMRGVWKPKSFVGEVLAYRAALLVNSRLIPPTVFRTMTSQLVEVSKIDPLVWSQIEGSLGSLQFFVDSKVDLLQSQSRSSIWDLVPMLQKDERDAFMFVFGNWDRHWGNVLVDNTNNIVMIDNSSITSQQKVQFGFLPFLKRYKLKTDQLANFDFSEFPFEKAEKFDNSTATNLFERASLLLVPQAFETMKKDLYEQTQNGLVLRKDISLSIVPWKDHLWIQYIGFRNYGVLKPKVLTPEAIEGYRNLNFENLRQIFTTDSKNSYPDSYIMDILDRRDQMLRGLGRPTTIR